MKNESPGQILIFSLGRAWLALKRKGRKLLAEKQLDLTLEQVMVLTMLYLENGLNIGELSERADRDRTTTSRMIAGLENKNLVLRIPDKKDSRGKLVYLTNLGKQKAETLMRFSDEVEKQVSKNLTESEIRETARLVTKIIENLANS